MKPIIIIPDSNQKTITMTVEEFKKTIGEVWEEGYKEGQQVTKMNLTPYYPTTPYEPYCDSDKCMTTTTTNIINKRTFKNDKCAVNSDNIW